MFDFKVISAGYDCFPICERTLYSVQLQVDPDYNVRIVDDATPGLEQRDFIRAWCRLYGDRWSYTINEDNYGAVRSQYEGIRSMEPQDEDVIVFLDLDGDNLANPYVFDRLRKVYDEGALLTYGGYRPWPIDDGEPVSVSEFPHEIVENGSYRAHTKNICRFNHLRTVKWKVLREVPESYFQWPDGTWLYAGTDYAVMMSCLELVGGKYHVFTDEHLMNYNTEQPHPDNIRNSDITPASTTHIMNMLPLKRKF